MQEECEKCSSGKLSQLPSIESETDTESEDDSETDYRNSVVYYRWETADKHVQKLQIREPYEEAITRFKKSVVYLKQHIYRKWAQNKHYNDVKKSLIHD